MFDNNFLLQNEISIKLYEQISKMPIIDYHNHLDPKELYENKPFKNITEMWLNNDHYKWRLIRFSGTKWNKIVNSYDNFQKFKIFVSSVETAYLNPLYHWSHMELKRVFKVDEIGIIGRCAMQEFGIDSIVGLIPLSIMIIPFVLICHMLAKEKGKNVTLWTVLGIIPLVNFYAMVYLVGSVNTILEEKLDRVLLLLEVDKKVEGGLGE